MSNAYDAMSRVYDNLNACLDYELWADFVEVQFARYADEKPKLVLDMACGSGSMTLPLARRGYDMIGLDLSADMLGRARERLTEAGFPEVLLLEQDMTAFELYGTVDAVVCCLDSINHLTARGALNKCFSLVHNYLNPRGLFLFDVNTPAKFAAIYGENDYILDDEQTGALCAWRNYYDKRTQICDFDLTIFTPRGDGTYTREDTLQRERCYTERQLKLALKRSGFELLGIFGDYDFTPAEETDERWYVVARKMSNEQ